MTSLLNNIQSDFLSSFICQITTNLSSSHVTYPLPCNGLSNILTHLTILTPSKQLQMERCLCHKDMTNAGETNTSSADAVDVRYTGIYPFFSVCDSSRSPLGSRSSIGVCCRPLRLRSSRFSSCVSGSCYRGCCAVQGVCSRQQGSSSCGIQGGCGWSR